MKKTINYGIDLGTTNSSIASFNGTEMRVFKNRDLTDVTPSAVRIERTGRIIVGRRAYQTLYSEPENVATEFKRFMGKDYKKHFESSGITMNAEELSSEVLKSLLEDAKRQTGDIIDACVITVPAAFNHLQCEATTRAAKEAGLTLSPLLQEPIAAAMAYGMKPGLKEKRWLVYDLGGGTFDVAIVSTKDGHLSILEHQGDNLMGGKDFDLLIIKDIIIPSLRERFNLPLEENDNKEWGVLVSRLRESVENLKKDLSYSDSAEIFISDAGKDLDGSFIELDKVIKRDEVNPLIEPYISDSIELCKKALDKARLSKDDLESIILVGGSTYMPIVHEMLLLEFDIPLKYSIDPITVVAQGAAIYSASYPIDMEPSKKTSRTNREDEIKVELAYNKIGSDLNPLVAGRIDNIEDGMEIRIDAKSGVWTSGWIPLKSGYFEINTNVSEGTLTEFLVFLRDSRGISYPCTPDSFHIIHVPIIVDNPPLPHSIGIEIIDKDDNPKIDIVFPRSTKLPAKETKVYKADKTLKPSAKGDFLAIKVWEGEQIEYPYANIPASSIRIHADEINRPIPEGVDIEIILEINQSRKMKVVAYVPILDQYFSKGVYLPDPIKIDKDTLLELYEIANEEIKTLTDISTYNEDYDTYDKLKLLKEDIDNLYIKIHNTNANTDLDTLMKLEQKAREFLIRLAELRTNISFQVSKIPLENDINEIQEEVETLVEDQRYSTLMDRKQFDHITRDLNRQKENNDYKAMDRSKEDLRSLKLQILVRQDEFWIRHYNALKAVSIDSFVNNQLALDYFKNGDKLLLNNDIEELKPIVIELIALLPSDKVELTKSMAMKSGLRKRY